MERRKQSASLQTLLSMNRHHANQAISMLKQLKALNLAQRQQASELAQLQHPGGGGGGVGRRSLQHMPSAQERAGHAHALGRT